ncbi:MAG: S-layer homology domain-containing protein [Acutalibacteraceae bacterium]|nr:S-layer homology domain-containing protein [Acutalibacteraceae bacterium]
MKRLTSIFLVLAMLLTLAPMNIFAAEADKPVFSDMNNTDYYAQAATALEQLNILAGYPDGTFGAEKSITRAEMAAIVCRMIDKEADAEKAKGETAFDDVKSDHWASGYINIASKEGIINGDGNGKFRPEDNVKHEEAIKMVVCALGYGDDVEVEEKDWSKGYLEVADEKGISADLKGTKGKASTRGDVAVMSYNGLATDAENAKIPATPVASKEAGEYKGTQKVKLTTTTKDAEIYYTTDGTTPTEKSTKYTKEISISKTSTLKAIAVKNGVVSKGVMSAKYTIEKISSGGGGGSSRPTTYTLSFATATNGTIDTTVAGSYAKNSTITLTATPSTDYTFVKWTSNNGGTFENANASTTTFTMPAGNVEITATFAEVESVPEDIATLFGVDPDEYDTDNDGLSNYIEIYVVGTDPKLIDSDEDGVNDADEDADEDGLKNIEEVEAGTDLAKSDSDNDGLTDLDEINTHNTEPTNYDTDGDSLCDGDEILLGLNPLIQKTDGTTLDSERTFTQELSENNMSDELLDEENDAIPSLTLTASGNINKDVSVSATVSNDFTDSRAIVGNPIDISGENVSEGTLTFTLNNDGIALLSVDDSSETFNTNLICKYNEDGSIEYLDTDYDESTNSVSAEINSAGTYYVLDVKNLFDELGLAMPTVADLSSLTDPEPIALMSIDEFAEEDNQNQNNNANESAEEISLMAIDEVEEDINVVAASAETEKVTLMASSGAMAQADIVFIIDTTGSMSGAINNVKNNVKLFVDELKSRGVSAGLALVEYRDIYVDGYDTTKVHKNGSSNWFYDMDVYKEKVSNLRASGGGDGPESAVDALETARLLDMRASAGKIFILVTDADYKAGNRYDIPSMAAEIELLKNAGVSCSVVTGSYYKSLYYNLYNDTNGIWADLYGNFNTELTTLADKIGEEIVGDGYWIYLQGPVPVPVRLNAMPEEGSTEDTDEDDIPDIEELESVTPTGEIDLDELVTKISKGIITGTDYGVVKMYKYKSSPVEKDTDFDGTDDIADAMPKSNSIKGIMHYEGDKTCNIDFVMDYRNLIDGNNKTYQKNLSELSILYASDVYDNLYIELNQGIIGGNDDPKTFGSLLGLKDTACYEIKADDYAVDKDDVTEFFVGHKKINYNGVDNEVIVVSVRGTNGTNAEWSSNFDVGADTPEYYAATGSEHPDWVNKENHKGFDVSANRVLDVLEEYISTNVDADAKKSILITGHSRGAAIANIIGAHFEDNPNFRSYTYTFATPNSTTSTDASNYKTVFNVKNKDDLIPYLPISEWGFTNYGVTKSISIAEYYENKWFAAQEGTWEWFIGEDYNNDGGTSRTLNAFAKISTNRNDLYKLDTSDDGKVWENNAGHITYAGAEEELNQLKTTLQNEKLLKFCNVYIVGGGISYHVEINYSPAYLMQTLCNMTTKTGPKLGHDVKGKYASAKSSFVASSGKIPVLTVVGGMTHPHMQPTYYIIAHHNFKKLD